MAAALLLVLVAGLPAACGGGDEPTARTPPGSATNPLVGLPNPGVARTPPIEQSAAENGVPEAKATVPATKTRAGASPSGARVASSTRTQSGETAKTKADTPVTAKDPSPTSGGKRRQKPLAPSATRPCSLVTKAQASAIIGAPIAQPLEAPQGPTCIYRASSGKRFITLAVLAVDFTKLKKQIRNPRRIAVRGRTGYCGTYGRPMLYLPLARNRVLSISGPCSTGARFAAKAAPRL